MPAYADLSNFPMSSDLKRAVSMLSHTGMRKRVKTYYTFFVSHDFAPVAGLVLKLKQERKSAQLNGCNLPQVRIAAETADFRSFKLA